MEDNQKPTLAQTLAAADDETIKEILREAESYLSAQLAAGLAADARAMTFASVLAAIASFLIGGIAALIAAKIDLWPYIVPAAVIVISLLVALKYAVRAAKPTRFDYVGNDPENWAQDIEARIPLTASLAGQAQLYSEDIKRNAGVLKESQRCLRVALRWSLWGTLSGAIGAAGLLGYQTYQVFCG